MPSITSVSLTILLKLNGPLTHFSKKNEKKVWDENELICVKIFTLLFLLPWENFLLLGLPFIHGPTDTQLFTLAFDHIDQYLSISFQKYQKILEKTHINRFFCILFFNEFLVMRWNWRSIESALFLRREWNSRLFKLRLSSLLREGRLRRVQSFLFMAIWKLYCKRVSH